MDGQTTTKDPQAGVFAYEQLIQLRGVLAEFFPDYNLTRYLLEELITAQARIVDPQFTSLTTRDRKKHEI